MIAEAPTLQRYEDLSWLRAVLDERIAEVNGQCD